MSNEQKATASNFWGELFQFGLYKRSQGRVTRQVTFGALAVTVAIGCWQLSDTSMAASWGRSAQYGVPLALFALGIWFVYRLVNIPRFADFLIAVEAEMVKVSWPSRSELIRSSTVVIVTIFGLAAVLALYDFFWNWLLTLLRVKG
jgi:preprotein translocase subunit SecE